MEIYKKILAAKQYISMTDMEKEGFNPFSKFKYFNPDQVNNLVFLACQESNLLTLFNLKRNEFGMYGELSIIDIDTSEVMKIEMATAIPEITATNAVQQVGGCVTYTERYMKMTAFGISDNSLDPDTGESAKNGKSNNENAETVEKKWLNKNTKDYTNVVEKLKSKAITMKDVTDVYKMRKDLKEELLKAIS